MKFMNLDFLSFPQILGVLSQIVSFNSSLQILQTFFIPFYAYLFFLGNFKYFLFEFTDSFICLVESDIDTLLN